VQAIHFIQDLLMKKIAIVALMAMASGAFAQKTEADFEGFYVGAQVGSNHSDERLSTQKTRKHDSIYPALVVGHNTAYNGVLYGVEAFADFHNKSTTQRDAGMGFKAGKVIGDVLVYARVGMTGSSPSVRPQLGVGAQYKLQNNLSLNALLSHDKTTDDNITRKNTSVAVGVNYHFN
jgi:outer membrane immunogenic protein